MNQQQSQIPFIVLDRGVVRPDLQHLRQHRMNFVGVAGALRQPQSPLLCDPQLRRYLRSVVERRLGNIGNPVFLGVLADRDQFSRIAGSGFERALPIIFAGGFFTKLRVAPRQIHVLHDRIERVTIVQQQLLDLAPALESAERIEVLQKKLAAKKRFLERNRVERLFEFFFSIQPGRERKQIRGIAALPLGDPLSHQFVATRSVDMFGQIKRE